MDTNELISLFRRNCPDIVRAEPEVRRILALPETKTFEVREGEHCACAVMQKNDLLLLAVDEPLRGRGFGSGLLRQAEAYAARFGEKITVGAGDEYLMPGVPMGKPLGENMPEVPGIPQDAADFFWKRGYTPAWTDCFDMSMDMADFPGTDLTLGCTVKGITYRWAVPADIPSAGACTDEAEPGFTVYTVRPSLYAPGSPERLLVACDGDTVVGTLIVGTESEKKDTGSIGCTAVRTAYQGRHIAVNLVILGTALLKAQGMKQGFLGYTYTGLDKLYGHAGYRICRYFFMAEKCLVKKPEN